MHRRPIGKTDIQVSPVALGCWPISGMTSLDVNETDSLATVHAAIDHGINFFDTAYGYGTDGESEKLLRTAFSDRRNEMVIATKVGLHWDDNNKRVLNSRPDRLQFECNQSLNRLGTDYVDLLYLHACDGKTPIADSAGALNELLIEGKTRSVGASNLTLDQMREFHSICPLSAFQPAYNMLQRDIEAEIVPWCVRKNISLMVYWPLLKGLLAGKLSRDHVFQSGDGRAKYSLFQGEEWEKNQDVVDRLREIARDAGRTVAQVVVNWTIHQPGITAALCGAKRAYQIEETAGAMGWQLTPPQMQAIQNALDERGTPASMKAV